eukprot:1160479-Pelagomonas_calceolata.AAC.5
MIQGQPPGHRSPPKDPQLQPGKDSKSLKITQFGSVVALEWRSKIKSQVHAVANKASLPILVRLHEGKACPITCFFAWAGFATLSALLAPTCQPCYCSQHNKSNHSFCMGSPSSKSVPFEANASVICAIVSSVVGAVALLSIAALADLC